MEAQERWYLENIALDSRVIADVGANVGRFSELFWRHAGAAGRVVSIEPQPENVARIEEKIAAASAANWVVEACAVARVEGSLTMRVFDVAYGKNSVVVTGAAGGDVREVRARRLQDLVPGAQVVKLDIEGHEYDILPEAVPALARAEVWALELHMVAGHALEATLKLFVDHGYTLHAAGRKRDDPGGAWVSVPITARLGWGAIPGTPSVVDGLPGVFKMLHVLARRTVGG
jgi:FkbM family methyltransferase